MNFVHSLARPWLLIFLAMAVPQIVWSQLQLAADINQTDSADQSKPARFTPFGSQVLFVATSAEEGKELWITDGTTANTRLVKDIRPGNLNSDPIILAVSGTTAYLAANDGIHGRELWKTDGTEQGTVLVKDVWTGIGDGVSTSGGIHNGVLYFSGQSSDRNTELWKSDGTEAGTVLVEDIQPNGVNPGSSPRNFISAAGVMFFVAIRSVSGPGNYGTELWKTDGTEAGTDIVKDIGPGSASGDPRALVQMGGQLYFVATDATSGLNWEVWKSDGTSVGTAKVKEIGIGITSASLELCVHGNTIFFGAQAQNFNRELWKTDGTEAGTVLVKEIRPGTAMFQGSDPVGFRVVGSQVYFFALDGLGYEVWKTDGTEAGTVQVADLTPGTGSGGRVNDPGTAPFQLEAAGTTACFYGTDGTSGGELWKTDGTAGGTMMVKELALGAADAVIREMTGIGGLIYFSAVTSVGTEPYVSDGTTVGTFLLKDIGSGSAGSNPNHLTAIAGKLYFSANDGINGRELWVADSDGARLVKNVDASLDTNTIRGIGGLNGTAYFGSTTQSNGSTYELFRSDGSEQGTMPVGAIAPLSPLSSIPGGELFQSMGHMLFFSASTPAHGTELWRTDGTALGSTLVKDLNPGPEGVTLDEMTPIDKVMYFIADPAVTGVEVYRTDGTTAGTKLVEDLSGDSFDSDASSLCEFRGALYFNADSPVGSELYKSNGTAAGTAYVLDLNPGGSSFVSHITRLNDTTLLFSAFHQDYGTELWKSDGTAAGTVLVKNIQPGTTGSSPAGLLKRSPTSKGYAVINGVAYFSATTSSNGEELWRSDGTNAGTFMVKDLVPGTSGGDLTEMVVVDDELYFIVIISGGTQLWKSDGTSAGTVMVDDSVASLENLTLSGTDLYAGGFSSEVNFELFKIPNVRPAPFAFSQSPAGQNIVANASFTLQAAVSGAGAKTFQWRRNGIAIPNATALTYTVPKATEAHQGAYDLLVREGNFELLSNAAQINVGDPNKLAITQQPLPRLALTNTSVSLQVSVIGQAPQFQWYKGTVLLPGQTGSMLTFASVQLSDAGIYKVKITNALGSVTSASVQLAVVDSAESFVPGKLNSSVTLTAPAVGTGLTYRWLRGIAIVESNSGKYAGFTTAKLKINKFTSSDHSEFTCIVSLGAQSVISGKQLPRVAAIPAITATSSPPTWIISGNVALPATALFSQSNLNSTPWNAPTIFSITGLPSGMTYNKTTGLITGRPQAGGGSSITLIIKVGNVAGMTTTAVNVPIVIEDFPPFAKGAFRGLVDRHLTLNNNIGNAVQADITALGSITGKLSLGSTSYSFTKWYLDTVPGSSNATAAITIARKGAAPLTLNIVLDGSTGAMSGTLTDGAQTTNFTAVRSPWSTSRSAPMPANDFDAAYTGVFQLQPAQVGDPLYFQGESYFTATVTLAGAANGAVRLADGNKVTFATLLGAQGQIPLHIAAYANTGSLHGLSQITAGTGNWDGTVTFYKAPQAANSTTRSYKAEVPLHSLMLVGGPWIKPTSAALLLGVMDSSAAVAPNNAEIQFSEGGIAATGLSVGGVYDTDLRIKAPASTFVLPTGTANPGKLTLKFSTVVTGEITGSFSSTDANPILPGKTVARSAIFYGVIVQRLNRGRGHFNLAELPSASQTNATKTNILSGLMDLRPLP